MADDVKRNAPKDRNDDLEIEAEDSSHGNAESPVSSVKPGPAPAAEIDYKDRWLRAEAELQNVRKRARRDVDDARRSAEEAVLLDLVGWLDDLERATEAARTSGAAASWADGVTLVLQKGREYLERMGVTAVDPSGLPFDPAFHEAVLEVDPPAGVAGGTVVQVIGKGYRRGARPLRPARVVVARESSHA